MKRRAILYARFSPRPNARECESVKHQLAELRDLARRNEDEVVAEKWDEDRRGDDCERPGLWGAVAACKRGYALYARDVKRIARDTYLYCLIEKTLQSHGATIVLQQGPSGDDEDAQCLREILAVLATRERKMIAMRTKYGMLRNQANGRRMSKIPPYGWRIDPEDPKRLLEEPAEKKVVNHMVELRTIDGLSQRQIAGRLNRDGVTCRGGVWHHQRVGAVLRRAGF